jgi:intein/homing endonuclease
MAQSQETILVTGQGILHLGEMGDTEGAPTQNISIPVATQVNYETATQFFVSGNQNTAVITFESGMVIEVALNHTLRVLRNTGLEFVPARNIVVGDDIPYRIGIYSNTSDYQNFTSQIGGGDYRDPPTLVEDIAWMLGFYLSNGTDNVDGITVTGLLSDLTKFVMIIERMFGIRARFSKDPDGQTGTSQVISPDLVSFLTRNGLLRGDDSAVRIPLIVRKSPISVLRQYIAGYHASNPATLPITERDDDKLDKLITVPNSAVF